MVFLAFPDLQKSYEKLIYYENFANTKKSGIFVAHGYFTLISGERIATYQRMHALIVELAEEPWNDDKFEDVIDI